MFEENIEINQSLPKNPSFKEQNNLISQLPFNQNDTPFNSNELLANSNQSETRSKIITNAQGQQEEIVYVPTPIDEETFKKMNKGQTGNLPDYQNDFRFLKIFSYSNLFTASKYLL